MKVKLIIISIILLLVMVFASGCIPFMEKLGLVNPTDEEQLSPEKSGPPEQALLSGIEMGMFVNRPLSSPPWYPDECVETDSYRWAPKYYWAVPSLTIKVNATASGITNLDDVVAEVEKGFVQWDGASVPYSVTVTRDDEVGPGLDIENPVNTVSWGKIDGPGGIVAITYFWYYVITKELIDCDILFDEAEPWSISKEVPEDGFDVWNIATHEAGHTLVLADLRSPKDGALTMHAYTWKGDDFKRILGLGDELGIEEIYGE